MFIQPIYQLGDDLTIELSYNLDGESKQRAVDNVFGYIVWCLSFRVPGIRYCQLPVCNQKSGPGVSPIRMR